MSLLAGNLTVSRLRVLEPELHDGWRELYRDRLDEFAFRAPPTGIGKEEVEGWCQVHNLLDTSFEDFGTVTDYVFVIGKETDLPLEEQS